MFRQTRFLSRTAAELFPANDDGVLVSITDPGTPPPVLGPAWRDILRLEFFDADDHIAAEVEREGMTVCQPEHAERILGFLDRWHRATDGPGQLIVHCEQGISRSAAVARFAARRYDLAYPWDHPWHNTRVLRLLDAAAASPEG